MKKILTLLVLLALIGCTKEECEEKKTGGMYCLDENDVISCQFVTLKDCEVYKYQEKSTGICYEGFEYKVETCREVETSILGI